MQTSLPIYSLIYITGQVKGSSVRCKQLHLYKKESAPRNTMFDAYTILKDSRKEVTLIKVDDFFFRKSLLKLGNYFSSCCFLFCGLFDEVYFLSFVLRF